MSENGYAITVRDISFLLLCRSYDDATVAYKSIFGDCSETELGVYTKSKSMVALKKLLTEEFGWDKDDITFEENKAYMLKLKKDTEKAMEDGTIEAKDGLKILADISVKLNDKFGAKEEMKDQMVEVVVKYNEICSCGREIYVPTKEDLMKKYNLVEKK